MKKLLLMLLMITSISSYSQADSTVVDSVRVKELKKDIKYLRTDAVFKLSIALFSHGIAFTYFISGPIKEPGVASQFIMYSVPAVTFDVLAIVQLCKARKKKNELNKILNL